MTSVQAAKMKEGESQNAVRIYRAVLRRALTDAVRAGQLTRNPVADAPP